MRVLIYDTTQRGMEKKFLSAIWETAYPLVDSFDIVIPAEDWEDVYAYFKSPSFPDVMPIDKIQFWGHGYSGKPLIDGHVLNISKFAAALHGRIDRQTEIWFRACDVFSREDGKDFAKTMVSALQCNVVGHTRVISLPWLNCQSGGFGLRPGEVPHWSVFEGVNPDGSSKGSHPWAPNTCSVFTRNPPRSWYR